LIEAYRLISPSGQWKIEADSLVSPSGQWNLSFRLYFQRIERGLHRGEYQKRGLLLILLISFLNDTVKVRTTGQFGWQLATESDLEFGKKPRMWMVVFITTWHLDLCPVGLIEILKIKMMVLFFIQLWLEDFETALRISLSPPTQWDTSASKIKFIKSFLFENIL